MKRPNLNQTPPNQMPPNRLLLLLSAVLASCVLTACASTPQLRYHTLVPPAAPASPASGALSDQANPFVIEVVPISVPEVVDRPQLVVRLTDSNGLRVLEQQQWASPLQSEIRNAISFALSAKLNTRDVYNVDHPAVPVYRIAVTTQRFETIIGGASTLQAAWSVRKPNSDQLASCQTKVSFIGSDSVGKAVEGFQQAIYAVADSIAIVVRKFVQEQEPDCPEADKTL